MMVLLSPQKRWRNKDRNTWCFFPHHKKCFCDYKTEGCRKQRLLVESISRLEFFNRQYQKLRESVKEKIDLSLQRFYKQNERYIRQFEEKLRRRENVKTKRQKRMLEISSYIDKIKNERRLEKIENYRKVAESAEKDEHERKLNYERLKEKLKEKRKKELEFVSPKKVTPILPPLVENDVTKEPERIDIIKEDPDLIDVTEEKSELEEEIEEEEESFSLPSIEVKMKDQKISALEKLRKIRTEKTTENAQPKRATKKKKINKLPPLTSMRSKLRLALGNREKITPKERVSITPEAESPQSKKSRRRRRKKHSSKKKHKDKTVVESTTNNNVETLREEQKPPTPPLEIEKPPETPKTPPPPPPPDYLEVDLGKEHFVQQIVLENFRDDGKKAFSIHVLDEGLATRYIRVHPTKNKNRFQINETLLGVELKQDENTKNGRRRRPKRTKRIMDTAIDENLMNRSPKPPTPPRSPLPPPSPPTSDIVENESESESSEGDFDDFEDDLIVRRSSLSTDDGSLSEKSKKADRKTSIFSLNDIQEDIEKEELLRRLKEEEEEKRLEEEHQRLMKRNRLLAEKRHQIKKQLQQKRRNQLSSNQKEKQGKMRMVRILMNKQLN
ncbi:golgin subfamily A member 6-like protein 24 isoform X2 [Clytia hemisphaerica]